MRVNIIGGGLAGCALAYVLKQADFEPVIYEAGNSIAGGTSGHDVGLYNPRFLAAYDEVAQFYTMAFQEALGVFEILSDDIDWRPCGAMHLINTEQKEKRFAKMAKAWPDDTIEMQILARDEASAICGIPLEFDALYLPRSGAVSPKKLCEAYVQDVEVHLNARCDGLSEGVSVLACGMGCLAFDEFKSLPLKPIRGQITFIEETDVSRQLNTTIGYGGYIAPSLNGVHCLGSSFERKVNSDDIKSADNLFNISKLCQSVNFLSGDYSVQNARAGVRVSSPDYCPIIGQLNEGVYVSTAHGSHGILSSLGAAKLLCDLIARSVDVPSVFSPHRFD